MQLHIIYHYRFLPGGDLYLILLLMCMYIHFWSYKIGLGNFSFFFIVPCASVCHCPVSSNGFTVFHVTALIDAVCKLIAWGVHSLHTHTQPPPPLQTFEVLVCTAIFLHGVLSPPGVKVIPMWRNRARPKLHSQVRGRWCMLQSVLYSYAHIDITYVCLICTSVT